MFSFLTCITCLSMHIICLFCVLLFFVCVCAASQWKYVHTLVKNMLLFILGIYRFKLLQQMNGPYNPLAAEKLAVIILIIILLSNYLIIIIMIIYIFLKFLFVSALLFIVYHLKGVHQRYPVCFSLT